MRYCCAAHMVDYIVLQFSRRPVVAAQFQEFVRETLRVVALELVKSAIPIDTLQHEGHVKCMCPSVKNDRVSDSCRIAPASFCKIRLACFSVGLGSQGGVRTRFTTMDRPCADAVGDVPSTHKIGDSVLSKFLGG